MKIIKAKDYGFRKVIQVVMDETLPRWVHPNGTASPQTHTGDTEERGKTVCRDCRSNWDIREYQWDGDALQKLNDPEDPESELIDKTDEDIMAEALGLAMSMVTPARDMVADVGGGGGGRE